MEECPIPPQAIKKWSFRYDADAAVRKRGRGNRIRVIKNNQHKQDHPTRKWRERVWSAVIQLSRLADRIAWNSSIESVHFHWVVYSMGEHVPTTTPKISVVVFNSCMKRLCDAVGWVPMAENQPERNKIGLGIGGIRVRRGSHLSQTMRRTLTVQYGDAAFILASQDYWKEHLTGFWYYRQTIFLRIVK